MKQSKEDKKSFTLTRPEALGLYHMLTEYSHSSKENGWTVVVAGEKIRFSKLKEALTKFIGSTAPANMSFYSELVNEVRKYN